MPPDPPPTPARAESRWVRHNRIYMALLTGLGGLCALAVVSMAFMARNPRIPVESRWVFEMCACMYATMLAGIVATLILRGKAPRAGRIATMALNIVLLIFVPVGTALGLYGLLKVDKADPPPGA